MSKMAERLRQKQKKNIFVVLMSIKCPCRVKSSQRLHVGVC